MKLRFVVGLAVFAAQVQAQANACPAGTVLLGIPDRARVTQDACQKAVDLFQFMAPQLGTAIAGGNATVGGSARILAVGVRVNAVLGEVPDVAAVTPSASGAQNTIYEVTNTPVPMATADAALKVFGGIPLAVASVGGVDLLASATYIPKVDQNDLSIEPDNPLKIGYGVRINALSEGIATPGVAFTWIKRDLPVLTMTGTTGGAATLTVSDFTAKTTAWRIVASKSFLVFGLAAGYGKDKYESGATAQATSSGQMSDAVEISQNMSRSNMFADLSFNLAILKVVAEVGRVSGGDAVSTFNTFRDSEVNEARNYASVGLRFGW